MRAMVTGATGFVGSHLVDHLCARGDRVAILRRRGSDPARIAHRLADLEPIEGTLGAIDAPAIARFRPEVVYHLAWRGVAGPERDDASQLDENLRGTLGLLRIAADSGALTFVALGSQAEFGPRDGPIAEGASTDPNTWYGIAKDCTHRIARRLADDLGLRFAWVRLFSAYGPGDHPGALIPTLIRSLLAGMRPALTPGMQRWDYLHVCDAAEALRLVGENPEASGAFNLGSGRTASIRSVAERIRDLIDPSLPLGLGMRPYGPRPIMHLQADIGRMRRITGWRPRIDLDDGLRQTIAWHRRAA